MLRSGNKKAAIATLAGDAAKGWFALWLAERLQEQYGITTAGLALVALAVFVGHLYPVFFRFQGGSRKNLSAAWSGAVNTRDAITSAAPAAVFKNCLRLKFFIFGLGLGIFQYIPFKFFVGFKFICV